jgi:hypothetical protein
MRRVFGITLLLALSSAISFAADATFPKNGKRVCAIEFASPGDEKLEKIWVKAKG